MEAIPAIFTMNGFLNNELRTFSAFKKQKNPNTTNTTEPKSNKKAFFLFE